MFEKGANVEEIESYSDAPADNPENPSDGMMDEIETIDNSGVVVAQFQDPADDDDMPPEELTESSAP
jgi:hypothetical protein